MYAYCYDRNVVFFYYKKLFFLLSPFGESKKNSVVSCFINSIYNSALLKVLPIFYGINAESWGDAICPHIS